MFGKYRKLYNEMVVKQCESKDQIHNLTLYLYWLEKNFPDIYEDMQTYFEGMAGYLGDKLITEKLPPEFYCNV